jgi:hypothetical protein
MIRGYGSRSSSESGIVSWRAEQRKLPDFVALRRESIPRGARNPAAYGARLAKHEVVSSRLPLHACPCRSGAHVGIVAQVIRHEERALHRLRLRLIVFVSLASYLFANTNLSVVAADGIRLLGSQLSGSDAATPSQSKSTGRKNHRCKHCRSCEQVPASTTPKTPNERTPRGCPCCPTGSDGCPIPGGCATCNVAKAPCLTVGMSCEPHVECVCELVIDLHFSYDSPPREESPRPPRA